MLIGFAIVTYGIIPSTKTAAGMIIAPTIVNSTVLQSDIPELYTLGVNRLKEALAPAK